MPGGQAYICLHTITKPKVDRCCCNSRFIMPFAVHFYSIMTLLLFLYVLVDALYGSLAGAHRENDGGGTGGGITAAEHTLAGGLTGVGVGLNAALLGDVQAGGSALDKGGGAGADGDDDGVHGQNPYLLQEEVEKNAHKNGKEADL